MDLQCIFELVAFGRGEDDTGSQAGAHLGAVEVHPPMGGVRRWRQVLGLGPVNEEVSQCLGLDGGAGLVEDCVRGQLDGPFRHPTGCIPSAYDLGKWSRADHRDWMFLKVRLQFLGGKVQAVAHLLVVGVVLLGGRQYLAQVIYWSLDR